MQNVNRIIILVMVTVQTILFLNDFHLKFFFNVKLKLFLNFFCNIDMTYEKIREVSLVYQVC